MSIPLIAVVGATGTGKSALALDLAETIVARGGAAEIVGADAMQLYRGMDIGTAKVPEQERRGVPHHGIDTLDPSEDASVAQYQLDARTAIEGIRSRGAVPILVGGSGLYVSSVLFDFQFPGTDAAVRTALETDLVRLGPGMLFRRLADIDPVAAERIGPHNGRRIVRALEVIAITGEPFRAGLPDEESLREPTAIIGLRLPREALVARLDDRVEQMWRAGLVAESEELGEDRLGTTARRAIGYAQAFAQLRGELDEAGAIAETQALTRRYARRQVGWFRRYPTTEWIDADDPRRLDVALARVDA